MHTQPVLAVHTVILTANSPEQALALAEEIATKQRQGQLWHCFHIPRIARIVRHGKTIVFTVSTEGDLQTATQAAGHVEIHRNTSMDKFANRWKQNP